MINPKTGLAQVKLPWGEQKTKLKGLYPTLTEEDFNYDLGKKDVMLNKLATKISKTREELEDIMKAL